MKLKLSDLKKTTDELARNLEIAHGVRTCKVCGHTPEKLYKAVEKMVKQRDEEIFEDIKKYFETKRFNSTDKDQDTAMNFVLQVVRNEVLKIIKEKYGNT